MDLHQRACSTTRVLDVTMMVHGDDFFACGCKDALDKTEAGLRERYECKVQRLGWSAGREKEARVLGRSIILDDAAVTVEADAALLEEASRALGLGTANAAATPAASTPAVKAQRFGDVS